MAGKTTEDREALQVRTRELYEHGNGCRAIAKVLGEDPTATYRRLQRMGLNRSREEAYDVQHAVELRPLPFQRPPGETNLRSAAIGEAVRWFLLRGYNVSVPVEPARYDLVAESDEGFKRVQVKSTSFNSESGAWVVHAHRTEYDATATPQGSAGKRRPVAYKGGEIDFFFIVTGDNSKYLIPLDVLDGARNLSLGKKYEQFKV